MNFSISDEAADKLFDSMKVADGEMLRISIRGGGCAGFEYQFEIETNKEDDDWVFEHQGATVLIDPVSAPYVEGATLDYVSQMFDSRFVLKNPNSKSTCGCGQSFAA